MVKRERPIKRQSRTPRTSQGRISISQEKPNLEAKAKDSVTLSISTVRSWDDMYQYILSESRKSKAGFQSSVLSFRNRLSRLCGFPLVGEPSNDGIDQREVPPSFPNVGHAIVESGIHSSERVNEVKREDVAPGASPGVPLKRGRGRPRKDSLQGTTPNPNDISKYFVKKEPPTIVNESPQGTVATKMEGIEY